MPAIAPIEGLRNAQKEFLAAKDLEELKQVLENGAALGEKMSVNSDWLKETQGS
jgi:hypothetical protein